MKNFGSGIMIVVGLIGVIVIMALILSIPVMLLWNWLMPVIFGLTTITWGQAIGLSFLSGMLFKSTNTNTTNK